MPSITLINGDRAEMSLSEFVEYRRMLENIVPTIPAHDKPITEIVTEPVKRTKPVVKAEPVVTNSDSERTVFVKVATECGHSYDTNSPRGRKSALCPSCKRQNGNSAPAAEKPVEKAEKPAENSSEGSKKRGKREFSQEQYDKWLAAHGDEEMSAKWEKRIRWMITDGYEMSIDQKQEFLGFLTQEPRLTFAEAHEFRTDIVRNFKKVAR